MVFIGFETMGTWCEYEKSNDNFVDEVTKYYILSKRHNDSLLLCSDSESDCEFMEISAPLPLPGMSIVRGITGESFFPRFLPTVELPLSRLILILLPAMQKGLL